jgi:hypothetical protein
LTRETASTQPSKYDYLYQIQRISKTFSGETQYECRHFPVDSQRRSIVALNVVNAFGTGILLSTPRTGVSCDINSSINDNIPNEEFTLPGFSFDPNNFDLDLGFDPSELDPNLDYSFEIDGTNLLLIGEIDSPGFGTGIASGGDDTGISGLENTGDIAGVGDFGDIGDGAAIGSSDFGGGGGGGGLGEAEDNPSDLSDATPLGPMTTEPVPGGEAGVPPDGVCEGGVLVRVMGKIGEMENAIIEKGVDWTFPLTPPEELGLDSWSDGGSISFYVECPTGETQYVDPIEPDPFIQLSGPASRIVLRADSVTTPTILCSSGIAIDSGSQTDDGNGGVIDFTNGFIAYKQVTPSTLIRDCVCGGGTGFQTVQLSVTVQYPNGSEQTRTRDVTTIGSSGCFGGVGNFLPVSRTTTLNYSVRHALNSAGQVVS